MVETFKTLLGITGTDYDKYIIVSVMIIGTFLLIILLNMFVSIILNILGKEKS